MHSPIGKSSQLWFEPQKGKGGGRLHKGLEFEKLEVQKPPSSDLTIGLKLEDRFLKLGGVIS
jgi:hypothetical protein